VAAAQQTRGEVREEAILRATLELLAEVGYDQLTIDGVAARAHCSKATIYRRWQGKAELVITAVRRHSAPPPQPAPGTGSLREDLLAALEAMRSSLAGQDTALILGLMTAMRHDRQLAAVVREQVLDNKREVFSAAVARAVARGELLAGAGHTLLAEISSAMLLSRQLVTGEPLDAAFAQELVDDVLLPLLRHQHSR
jgi:AcrR family transcriptional regulator